MTSSATRMAAVGMAYLKPPTISALSSWSRWPLHSAQRRMRWVLVLGAGALAASSGGLRPQKWHSPAGAVALKWGAVMLSTCRIEGSTALYGQPSRWSPEKSAELDL